MTEKKPLTVMLVAGEASGDQHAANMFLELKKCLPNIKGIGMGGAKMVAAGIDIHYDSTAIAVIGVIEALKQYREISRALKSMQSLITAEQPDLLICVDYKEFNFKLAGFAKRQGVKVLFYVSPQVWAWRPGRAIKYGQVIDMMAVIFPFETPYYETHNIPVRYVGHPSVDKVHPQHSIAEDKLRFALDKCYPIVGLLPGSRNLEIKLMLPEMLQAAERVLEAYPDTRFILAQADSITDDLMQQYLCQSPIKPKVIKNQPYDVIQCCDAIMTTSGTATLEIALLSVPMVIAIKVSALTYWMGKRLLKSPYIGLPNIIAGKAVVKELIQHEATAQNLAAETIRILTDKVYHKQMQHEFKEIKAAVGSGGGSKIMADLAKDMLLNKIG